MMRVILVKTGCEVKAYVWVSGGLCPLDLWERHELEILFAEYEAKVLRAMRESVATR